MKKKRYDDGGLTFTEMSDEDRSSAARSAIEALNARQAAKSEEAGGAAETESAPRRSAPKAAPKAAPKEEPKPSSKEEKVEVAAPVARAERAPSSVKIEPITGPQPAVSRQAAMPDVAVRKAATAARLSEKTPRQLKASEDIRKAMGMKSGGSVSQASKRADGCAIRGKTRGRMV